MSASLSRHLPLLALLFTMIVWGIGPVFIRTLSVALGPVDHLAIRYGLVAIVFITGLAFTGGWRIATADWPRLLVISFIGMLGYNLGSAFGFERASASLGSLVIGTQPLIIALIAMALVGERLTAAAVTGLGVALCGVVLLFLPDLMAERLSRDSLTGAALIFFSGVAWGFYVVLSRPLIRSYGAFNISALSLALVTLPLTFVLPLIAGTDPIATLEAMTLRNWLEMAFMAGLSTFVATITWNYGAARVSAAVAGASLYLVPVIGVKAGALLLGERLSLTMFAGGGLILAGVAIAQFGEGLAARRASHSLPPTTPAKEPP